MKATGVETIIMLLVFHILTTYLNYDDNNNNSHFCVDNNNSEYNCWLCAKLNEIHVNKYYSLHFMYVCVEIALENMSRFSDKSQFCV